MCALRNSRQVRPELLAGQYRLGVKPRRPAPIKVKKNARAGSKDAPPAVNVADTAAKTQFVPKFWLEVEDDDEFDFDCDDIFSPLPSEEIFDMVDPQQKIYQSACKKYRRSPVKTIQNGLLTQKVSCKFTQLHKDDIRACSIALIGNRFVEEIDFESNELGPEGVSMLAPVISETMFITHLRLAENKIGGEGAELICDAVCSNKTLLSLDLSGNGFVETDAKHFKQMLLRNSSLRQLYLGNNGFREDGIVVLAQGLRKNETLVKLDLKWNHIRLHGALAIGAALSHNSSLESLNLSWNGLYLEGSTAIAKALQCNSTLTDLDLTNNRLNEECLAEILKGLAHNSTLENLRIGQNHITCVGAMQILQHVKDNSTSGITMLDFGMTVVQDKFVTMYQELKKDRDIEVIHGDVWKSDRKSITANDADEDEVALMSENPLTVLMECMRLQNFRLIDLFKSLDRDNSDAICIEELIKGFITIKVPLRRSVLMTLLKKLDIDNNGKLDFGELIHAQKLHKKVVRHYLAENVDLEQSELGRISRHLRHIMGSQFIMKKPVRSRAPSPATQDFDSERGITCVGKLDLDKNHLSVGDFRSRVSSTSSRESSV